MTIITIWSHTGNYVTERAFDCPVAAADWARDFMDHAPCGYSFNTSEA